jgi:glutamate carboxypeptidase
VDNITSDIVQEIIGYLRQQQAQMVSLLADLVRAESPSSSPETQAVPLGSLSERLVELGFDVTHTPGVQTGGYLVARRPGWKRGRPAQLLLGHCDTVWPVGTLAEMPLEITDTDVRGPGVYDMKAGLVQMVFALQTLRALGLETAVVPIVMVNSDEEIGSFESRKAIIELAQQSQRAFILEPSLGPEGRLKTARKGVGQFEVVVRGRAAHAGLDPEKGISAILAMSYVVQTLAELTDLARGVSVNVGVISGGLRSNVVAPECRVLVDARAPTLEDAARIEESFRSLESPLAGTTLEVSGGFDRPPLERTPRNQALWERAKELGRLLDLELEQGAAGGASDGNYTSLYTSTLDGLGAIGDGAHAHHEFVTIEGLVERSALLALLLLGSSDVSR